MNRVRRWPLVLISLPAAVAIWSGWVSLGQLCGFGLVQPLPGILPWHLNTAITLPVGVESYGAYALGAWLTPETPERARMFARRSAVGALALGMAGQVIYHLLAAAHAPRAPWPVVVVVSCMPVVTLGFGAALTHLLRVPGGPAIPAAGEGLAPAPDATADASGPVAVRAALNGHAAKAERLFRDDLGAGKVPGVRRIQAQLHVGQPKARLIQQHLRNAVAEANGSHPEDSSDSTSP